MRVREATGAHNRANAAVPACQPSGTGEATFVIDDEDGLDRVEVRRPQERTGIGCRQASPEYRHAGNHKVGRGLCTRSGDALTHEMICS